MMGRTHFVVGVATAVIGLNPITIKDLLLGSALAGIGSVISDIDSGTSKSHAGVLKILSLQLIIIVSVILLDFYFKLGLYDLLMQNKDSTILFSVILFFFVMCLIGMLTKHRTFTHSILGFSIYTSCVYIIFPDHIAYFIIAYISHILLDILNEQKISFLYPMQDCKFSIGFCPADGKFNWFLFIVGFSFMLWGIGYSIARICGVPGSAL